MSESTLGDPSMEAPTPAAPEGALIGRWLVQAVRAVVLLRPDWRGLRATPLVVAVAFFASLGLAIVMERFYIVGRAHFEWRALGYGWLDCTVTAWACWMLLPTPPVLVDRRRQAADASTLFAFLFFQAIVLQVVLACLFVPLVRAHVDFSRPGWSTWATVLPLAWSFGVQGRVLWQGAPSARAPRRAGILALLLVVYLANYGMLSFTYWRPDTPVAAAKAPAVAASGAASVGDADGDDDSGPETPMLKLSQGVFESQQRLFATQLDALQPERAGTVDVYAITFAPFADADVFMRESAVVAGVMESRFDARGRTLQLVNNVATLDRLAWATPLNLQRAIARVAQRMNRDEDVLFIHLTSHGGGDGRLATEFFPLTVDRLTPQLLRRWLDEAGIRNRVISVSACYSGSWIAPLADDDTLVMTAADANHTSYGCGSKSTLTFFGQAMYDEQLRHTWSFEDAHAAARKLIDERERAAGKTDGYSNPQIRMGSRLRGRLKQLEARLAASAAR